MATLPVKYPYGSTNTLETNDAPPLSGDPLKSNRKLNRQQSSNVLIGQTTNRSNREEAKRHLQKKVTIKVNEENSSETYTVKTNDNNNTIKYYSPRTMTMSQQYLQRRRTG